MRPGISLVVFAFVVDSSNFCLIFALLIRALQSPHLSSLLLTPELCYCLSIAHSCICPVIVQSAFASVQIKSEYGDKCCHLSSKNGL